MLSTYHAMASVTVSHNHMDVGLPPALTAGVRSRATDGQNRNKSPCLIRPDATGPSRVTQARVTVVIYSVRPEEAYYSVLTCLTMVSSGQTAG